MQKPSVLLMGSKPGAGVALEILVSRGWDVRAVVIPKAADPPWVPGPSLAERAVAHGVDPVFQADLPSGLIVDYVISYMYRNLVQPSVLSKARRAALNFHAAPLPEFGGWAFYNVAILEGVSEYGCTCHHMSESFDEGPLVEVRRFPIEPAQETAVTLERKAQVAMIQLFSDICSLAEDDDPLPSFPQDRSRMRYMTSEQFQALKRVSPEWDAEKIDRYSRAFWYPPYECAYLDLPNGRVELIPAIAKEEIASALHADDVMRLLEAHSVSGRPVQGES